MQWRVSHSWTTVRVLGAGAMLVCALTVSAQLIPLPPDQLPGNTPANNPPAAKPAPVSIASVATQGVALSGSLAVANGRATIGNDGTITAGDRSADVALTRGGDLKVCATTKIHLSTDNAVADGGGLMITLDRGAMEAHYTPGKYSDVVLTPDLRILISGPGQADLSLRVNQQGDTCVDNHGDQAPYVLASSLFEGGVYRVQPNQRVLFEHGSVSQAVDNEKDACGCPPPAPTGPASTSLAGIPGGNANQSQAKTPAPNETAARNPFPLAESEGLAPAPSTPATPAVPAGTPHAEVTAPLAYDANHPNAVATAPAESSSPPADAGATVNLNEPVPVPTSAIHVDEAPPAQPAPKPRTGFFGHIGHFFKRLFGGS
jgi:hypothetical protein